MSPIAFRVPLPGTSSTLITHSSNITPAPDIPWQFIGAAQDHLQKELEVMYWEGVKGELEIIIRTLKTWQQPQFDSVVMDDENEVFVHGFDTFIDQVSQESRAFAIRYGISSWQSLLFAAPAEGLCLTFSSHH